MIARAVLDYVLRGGILVPGGGDWEPSQADVRIRGERIVEVGRGLEAPVVMDVRGSVLLPGLVNAHLHLGAQFFRYAACRNSLRSFVECTDQFYRHTEDGNRLMTLSNRTTLAESVASGTTAVAVSKGAEDLFAAGVTGLGLYPVMRSRTLSPLLDNLVERVRRHADACRNQGLPYGIFLPSLRHVGPELLDEVAFLVASDPQMRLAVHFLESPTEDSEVETEFGCSAIDLLYGLGLLGTNTILVHCCHISERDIDLIARSGAHVVLCPASNTFLDTGVPPLGALRDAGIRCAIASDGPASGRSLSLLDHTRFAATVYRNPPLSTRDLLEAVTTHAACALGMEDEIGTLRVGTVADLILFEQAQFFSPSGRFLDELVVGSSKQPRVVICRGRVLVEHGLLVDERLSAWTRTTRGIQPVLRGAVGGHWH